MYIYLLNNTESTTTECIFYSSTYNMLKKADHTLEIKTDLKNLSKNVL